MARSTRRDASARKRTAPSRRTAPPAARVAGAARRAKPSRSRVRTVAGIKSRAGARTDTASTRASALPVSVTASEGSSLGRKPPALRPRVHFAVRMASSHRAPGFESIRSTSTVMRTKRRSRR